MRNDLRTEIRVWIWVKLGSKEDEAVWEREKGLRDEWFQIKGRGWYAQGREANFEYILSYPTSRSTADEVLLIHFIMSVLNRRDKHAHGLITSVLGRRGYWAYYVGLRPTWLSLDPSTLDVIRARRRMSDVERDNCCSAGIYLPQANSTLNLLR